MDRFGVAGISHRRASAEEIGAFTHKPADLNQLREHLGVDEVLHLSTCNRVEIYWVSQDKLPPQSVLTDFADWIHPGSAELQEIAGRAGYAFSGDAVHRHLHSVLCGLKSLVLGDEQIVGQFKSALIDAREAGTCGTWLGLLSDDSIKVSRQIRGKVDYSRVPTSVPEVAAEVLRREVRGAGGELVLIGSGEMIELLAARVADWNDIRLTFVNRTLEKAVSLAEKHGGTPQSLDAFLADPGAFDHLISATSSETPILSASHLRKMTTSLESRLILDLGIPGDTTPDINDLSGFRRMDVLEVSRQVELNREEAERLDNAIRPHLLSAGQKFKEKIFQRNLGPIAQKLRESIEERALAETDRWIRQHLSHLASEDQELVKQFALRLAEQTVQVPLIALKKTLRDMPMGDVILDRMRDEGRRAARSADEKVEK